MLLVKKGFPEEGELVMCTVTKVQFHSVFVNLDEYNKGGMIHISEVSPGRIRNIRDFVKEDKKVVCKVLRITEEKGHIDLSLRRVTESQKRAKVDEIKQEQKVEKIVELAANKLKLDLNKAFNEIADKVTGKYHSIYACFQEAVADESLFGSLGIEKKLANELLDAVKQRIKKAEVEIRGKLKLTSYQPDGVEIIKKALKKAEEVGKENIIIKYLGGGTYNIIAKARDYKEAEDILKKYVEAAIDFVSGSSGEGSFARQEA